MPSIARYYDAEKNPDRASLPGVPLADISEAQFAEYPEWLQATIDNTAFYRKTKPPKAKDETAPKLVEPTKPVDNAAKE